MLLFYTAILFRLMYMAWAPRTVSLHESFSYLFYYCNISWQPFYII